MLITEWQIIRLGSSMAFDHSIPEVPKYAPFVAAGFFFGSASFLHEVPFDPFLPWIFMGTYSLCFGHCVGRYVGVCVHIGVFAPLKALLCTVFM